MGLCKSDEDGRGWGCVRVMRTGEGGAVYFLFRSRVHVGGFRDGGGGSSVHIII